MTICVCVCVYIYIYTRVCVFVLVAQLCLTLCNPKGACQAPLSMGFSRQAYRSGLPFPSPNM